jgi:hypothetical protein
VENYDKDLARLITKDCQDLVETSDILVARVREGNTLDYRIIEKGQDRELIDYVINEKTEAEDVLVWSIAKLCNNKDWIMKFPAGMKAWKMKGRESVQHRRDSDFAQLSNGFSLKTGDRSGYLYYREDTQILEMYVEMSGVAKYNFILDWDGLEKWVYPKELITPEAKREELRVQVQQWLDDHGYKTNPPD